MSRQISKCRSLIHKTDLACAERIISTQTMIPSTEGLFGPGIYFSNTLETIQNVAHCQSVYLIADVYLGKSKEIITGFNQTQAQGYDSIIGSRTSTGRNFVVFDPARVKNIKYIYGTKPQAVFRTHKKRRTLFFATDSTSAGKIVEMQKMPKINGQFGKGYYMFDTITDAIQVNPSNTKTETYLVATAYLEDFHELANGENVNMPGYKSFLGNVNGVSYFVFNDPSLISRIHYCGGRPWNF